jgi:hypothetical protein
VLRRDLRTLHARESQFDGILAAAFMPPFCQIDAGEAFFGLPAVFADTMSDPCNRAGLQKLL